MRKRRCSHRAGSWKRDRRAWIAAGLLFGLLADSVPASSSPPTREQEAREHGVVVEEVAEASALEKAGLEPGDVLLAWERLPRSASLEGAQGELRSPFDWEWIKVEQAPRGTVRLSGVRKGDQKDWTVEPGLWTAKVRHVIPATLLREYLRGQEMVVERDIESGSALWRKLAAQENYVSLRCWLYWHVGDAWFEHQAWERGYAAYRSALEAAHEPVAHVAILGKIGRAYERLNDFDQAEASYRSALEIYRKKWGESLGFAVSLNSLGGVAWKRRQLDETAERYQRALEIREKLAPDSLEVAGSLNNLGIVAWAEGKLDEAATYYHRSLEINQELAPSSLDMASSLNNLGIVAAQRGQLAEAKGHLQRALKIKQELAPGSLEVANSLTNLGNIADERGQVDEAMEHQQRALEIRKKLAPDSLEEANILINLGNFATNRGQLEVAEQHYQRALDIWEELAPDSLDVVKSLINLGSVASRRGQLSVAEQRYQHAVQITQRLAPNSLYMAKSLTNLGNIASRRGELGVAAQRHQRALDITQKLAPNSLYTAKILIDLGLIVKGQGQLHLAESYFDRSMDVLNSQIGKLGSSQFVKGDFRAKYLRYYHYYVGLLLQRNRPEEAFAVLERVRARSFLAMIEERDLIFSDIPEELGRQRRSLAVRHDRTLRQLASINATKDQEKAERLQAVLIDLYRERDDLRAKIRRESPHLANLQEPQTLDLSGALQILDSGTVMLSYSVAEVKTDLFVVAPDQPLAVHTLAIGEDDLRKEVNALRELIEDTGSKSQLGPLSRKGIERPGKHLYRLLVEPATAMVATAERVILVPDGPLHHLPFAALIRELGGDEASSNRDWQYFTEWKPLHSVLSATVYAELKQSRRPAPHTDDSGPLLVALGDPHYALNGEHDDSEPIKDVRVRSSRERCGFDVDRLPGSRREVREIADLHRNVRTYLGQGAREEIVKSLDGDARIVHIAAHGCLDDRLPLNSGLFLTLPKGFPEGQDNGLLQAWEIFESVRLDADLVVLSACESALGQDRGGEGLTSLTRAFQYAGARTVAASLWQVDDQVTAELMVRFYRHLRGGKSKDAALRAAQVELIRAPIEVRDEDGQVREIDASAPYYWAAFQLFGDWQ